MHFFCIFFRGVKVGLAHVCGTNRTYLSTYFHDYRKQSFYNYINTLRIQKVDELLQDSRLTREAIAQKCGYNSARTMRAAYLKILGKDINR